MIEEEDNDFQPESSDILDRRAIFRRNTMNDMKSKSGEFIDFTLQEN